MSGESTSAINSFFPRNSSRASTKAAAPPSCIAITATMSAIVVVYYIYDRILGISTIVGERFTAQKRHGVMAGIERYGSLLAAASWRLSAV